MRTAQGIPGIHFFDRCGGGGPRGDGTFEINGLVSPTETTAVVAQIKAMDLKARVTTAAEMKARQQPAPGPDPDDLGDAGQ
jgi:hypothetical protein